MPMNYFEVVEEGGWEYHVRKRKKGRFAPDQAKQQLHIRIGEKLRKDLKIMCIKRKMTMSTYAAMAIAQQLQRDKPEWDGYESPFTPDET